MGVVEHTIELAGSLVFLRRAPAPDPTPLLLHGAPTSADDFAPLLERTGGIAVDLPGFGRSGKGGHLDLSPAGQSAVLAALLDHLELAHCVILAHDWSAAAALRLAAAEPSRVARLVLVNPLGPGADTRRAVRLLAVPGLGELAVGATGRRLFARLLRSASTPEVWPDERVAAIWAQFDPGTQRAVIRLAREPGPPGPEPPVPVAILHGSADPWWPEAVAATWAEVLPEAERAPLPEARHWPWLESRDAADAIAARLTP